MLPQIIGWVLMGITLGYLAFLTYRKRGDIWGAVIGEDNKLQISEFVIVIWLVLFPVVVCADIFLKLPASPQVWWSMDIILGLTLGYKATDLFKVKKSDET